MKKLVCGFIFIFCVLSGFSESTTITKQQAINSINKYFSLYPSYIDGTIFNFPATIIEDSAQHKHDIKQMNYFVALGFLQRDEKTEIIEDEWYGKKTQIEKKTFFFDLTPEGKKFYKKGIAEDRAWGIITSGFYTGTPKVKEITTISSPTSWMGQIVSQVQFTYIIPDMQPWVVKLYELTKDDDIFYLTGWINSKTVPQDSGAVLILTNNGWVHEKLIEN